jgi:transporter family protein
LILLFVGLFAGNGRVAGNEKCDAVMGILGSSLRRFRGPDSDLRKDRHRKHHSDFATFIRTIIILFAAGLIVYVTGNWQEPSSVSAKTWLFLILSGAATGASWICYFRALKLGDAGRIAPIDKLSVVFVAVFAVLFLGERLALPNWLGVILIACGAVLVAYRA